MKLIAHRGNINGPIPEKENRPDYIINAIVSGFYVEIDVWQIGGDIFLGHDAPQYKIDISFFDHQVKKWVYAHAKNIPALEWLIANGINCFSHDKDNAVLTLGGEIWTYPGHLLTERSICVMPEWTSENWSPNQINNVAGICSDYVGQWVK